jgi:Xaa-Pro aminopeptidase
MLNLIEKDYGYIADHPPIAAINENSANPHYTPNQKVYKKIKKGDFILLDLWARPDNADGVWSDITWVGQIDKTVPEKYARIFNIVAQSRDAAFNFVKKRFLIGQETYGYEVDDIARKVISKAGYGKYFIHRTGHSITTEGHGTGAHMDNYETHDNRLILPETSFSIEPGIYLPGKFGIRSEIDVYVKMNGEVISTGEVQKEVIPILA